jgi:hypothetical protein
MRIGDVSRARRFANPARLRWYAFHRSVRFAMRMMQSLETAPMDYKVGPTGFNEYLHGLAQEMKPSQNPAASSTHYASERNSDLVHDDLPEDC